MVTMWVLQGSLTDHFELHIGLVCRVNLPKVETGYDEIE